MPWFGFARASWCVLLALPAAIVQAQTTRPTTVPTTQPATDAGSAYVKMAVGVVNSSVLQADGTFGPWQPVKEGDRLTAGTRIRTELRSRVVLIFGDNTIVDLQRATLASIDQYRRGPDSQQISLGLGYGAVRAGAAETTLRSDMVIQTPTATLSKRGTFGIQMEYEPTTGHFRAALTDTGLITVLNRLSGEQRTVLPGQHVTDAMVRWIDTAKFNRWVSMQDVFGLTPTERSFNAFYNTGSGVSQPGAGMMANVMSGRSDGGMSAGAIVEGRMATTTPVVVPSTTVPQVTRAEGNFGARR